VLTLVSFTVVKCCWMSDMWSKYPACWWDDGTSLVWCM